MEEVTEPILKKSPRLLDKVLNTTKYIDKKPLTKKEEEDEKYKPKQPLLFLLKADGSTKIYENAKEGKIEIARTDKKTAIITLELSKLRTMTWGTDTLKYWIAYEKESTAYPLETEHDSAMQYQYIAEVISNTKNYEAQRINAWSGLAGQIVMGLIVLAVIAFFVIQVMGINPLAQTKTPEPTPETIKVNATASPEETETFGITGDIRRATYYA